MKTMLAAILAVLMADGAHAQQTLSPEVLQFYLQRYAAPPPMPKQVEFPVVTPAPAPAPQVLPPTETGFAMGIRRNGRALVRVAK